MNLEIFCLVLFLVAKSYAERGVWHPNGAYEYYVSLGGESSSSSSYNDSQKICEGKGGTLALVKTQAIQDFIKSLVTNGTGVPYAFFIGLRDFNESGTFVWDDGTQLDFESWGTSEPNNIPEETCVTAGDRYTYKKDLEWVNVVCTLDRGYTGYICEKPQGFNSTQNSTAIMSTETSKTGKKVETSYAKTTPSPFELRFDLISFGIGIAGGLAALLIVFGIMLWKICSLKKKLASTTSKHAVNSNVDFPENAWPDPYRNHTHTEAAQVTYVNTNYPSESEGVYEMPAIIDEALDDAYENYAT